MATENNQIQPTAPAHSRTVLALVAGGVLLFITAMIFPTKVKAAVEALGPLLQLASNAFTRKP